jgi:Ca-activated chloride channel family protein
MSDHSPENWLDGLLHQTPLPPALLEKLRAIAREEGSNGRLSDAMIDRLLVEVAVPDSLIVSLRAIAREAGSSRRAADLKVDRLLGDVPLPAGLTAGIRAALDDEALDERVRELPVPASLMARARIIPHLRRRLHPAFRAAAAVLLFVLIGGSYFAGVTGIVALSRPPERPRLPAMAVEWGPLELESTPDDEAVVIATAETPLAPATTDSRDEIALQQVDFSPARGPAGEISLAFETGFRPLQNMMDLRWRPLGARWADDDLPNLETVLATSPRGIEPPLVRGFDRVFLFKNGVFPIVQPSAHPALAVSSVPLSTSTASYDLTERLAADRRLPGPSEVRVEDFLAAVDYNFPLPEEAGAVKIRTFAGPSVFGRMQAGLRPQLLQVAAQAGPVGSRVAPATHLTIAIDLSASMKWNGRMEMAQRALVRLLDHLGEHDRLALVAFNEEVAFVMEDASRKDRPKLLETISRLQPSGGTNLDAGLRQAAALSLAASLDPGTARRVVLLTDGRAGLPLDEAEQVESFLREAAAQGLRLDVIDLSQQEELPAYMTQLASAGAGEVRQGETADQIGWALVASLLGKAPIVASGATLEVAFNPQAVAGYRLLGHEPSPAGAASPGAGSGDLRGRQAATALYEVWLLPNETDDVATARLSWIDPQSGQTRREEQRISRLQFSPSWAEAPLSLQAAAIAAQTAEALRESAHRFAASRDFGNILTAASEVNSYLAEQESFRRLTSLIRQLDQIQTRRGL